MVFDNFDLEKYILNTFDHVIPAGQSELRINCFSPDGCNRSDTKYHLYVNIEKKIWHCFRCGYGSSQQPKTSSLVRFIADAENKSIHLVLKFLEDRNILATDEPLSDLLENIFTKKYTVKENLPIILPKQFFPLRTLSSSSKLFLEYALLSRGLSLEDLVKYNVKYCCTKVPNLKYWRNKIVFPIYDLNGVCKSAIGRDIGANKKRWLFWPNSNVHQLLWPLGYFDSLKYIPFKSQETIVLVEGIFDALAVEKFTKFKALVTFGKKISKAQIQLLKKLCKKHVIIAWDFDAKKQIKAAVQQISGRFDTISVFPFIWRKWNIFDLGSILKEKKYYTQLQHELNNPVPIESTDYLKWCITKK